VGLTTTALGLARTGAVAGFAVAVAASPVAAIGSTSSGPSSSQSPYLVPLAEGVAIRSLLTVGDAVDGYRLVGLPDGMGLLGDEGDAAARLFVNHEVRPDLLDGTEGPQMMDNITVDSQGNVLIQEDPGGQAYLARV
jgi:hypothetical protein